MAALPGQFALTNPNTGEAFVFQYFPTGIDLESRANWNPRDTTIGVQPIDYANTAPLRITVDELLLDRSDTNISIESDLRRLLAFMAEDSKLGRPPTLVVIWGVWQETVVLESVFIKQKLFTLEGDPVRAYLSLTLIEFQEDGTNTSVKINDNDNDSGSGIGDF
ncbi:MAG: Contractile injection system tube protein [Blastocatellia bacterium]|jgi:hypothetical protein|nr:Contractile injection system tube protein [Blastocatellia bacterium]